MLSRIGRDYVNPIAQVFPPKVLSVPISREVHCRTHRPHRVLAWTLTLSAVVLSSTALAQSLQWDANAIAPVNGGSGTWDTAASRW